VLSLFERKEMNRIIILVLFVLAFSWPALANERFALVCDWELTIDLNTGLSNGSSSKSTFVFEENEKKLELKKLSGFSCDKIVKYQATEFNILIECESILGDGKRAINSIEINRFSGEISGIFQTWKDRLMIGGGLIYRGICTKRMKMF